MTRQDDVEPVTVEPDAAGQPVTAGQPVELIDVRAGSYHDSVTLMQVSRAVAAVPGVVAAQVAMATELNVDLLAGMGFAPPAGAGPNDLVVAVRAVDDAALAAARQALTVALSARPASSGGGAGGGLPTVAPRTIGSAVRAFDATLALVSVPGAHAFTEAMDALAAGVDVMVFSDNVPVAQEVRLKQEAARRGLLVMGPDCGTAVVGGVGLGFANVVEPGPVGLVAASGTGAQQVMTLLDGAGVGVRHCLGVGGRDLSSAVGGLSTRQALALLDADPAVELIVVVSKPPAPEVEREIRALAAGLSTPVRLSLLGPGRPDLTAAARGAAEALGKTWLDPQWWPAQDERTGRYTRLRGGFVGGTLCDEAMVLAGVVLGPIASNIPLDGAPRLAADLTTLADRPGVEAVHAMVDFGDDELTRGRPHPMIDGSLRAEWIVRQGRAASAGNGVVVLLDVVLGHGAHPDPAAELTPAIERARAAAAQAGGELAVVVSLCGTTGDPQGLRRQAYALQAAGASVHLSNADATRKALALLDDETVDSSEETA
jgi:FdrA protein